MLGLGIIRSIVGGGPCRLKPFNIALFNIRHYEFLQIVSPKDMHCYRRQSTQLSSLISPDFALESGNKNDSALSAEW